MKIYLDDSPTANGHSHRGIGAYTRNLLTALQAHSADTSDFQMVASPSDADLIHVPYFDLFFPTLPIKYLKPFGKTKPVVVTIHDVIPLLFPKHYPVGKKGWLAHQYQKMLLRFVSHVITDSKASAQDIHTYLGVPKDTISPIYLAAAHEPTDLSESFVQKTIKKYGITSPYILYVGDISYNKNIPALIESLEYMPKDISLVCVGRNFKKQPIPEWKAIHEARRKSQKRFRTNIHFIDSISNQQTHDLSALYQGAGVYVQPSLSEGFGLPVLEAMLHQTLVVSANTGSLPEVVGQHGILVDPDAQSLASGIQQALRLSAREKNQTIKQAHTWAQKFSWENTATQTISVYKKILEST